VRALSGGFNNQVFAADGVCVKIYRVDERPRIDREWQALTLLAEQAPGLAPRPLRRLDDRIEMELLPGTSLLDLPSLGRAELSALAEAFHRLLAVDASAHRYDVVATVPFVLDRLRAWPTCPVPGLRDRWLASDDPTVLLQPAPRPLAHCDPNLANFLLHDGRVSIVDWESAGRGDLAYELADFAEAYPARRVGDADWAWFAEQFEVDRRRYTAARRMQALHWTFLVQRRGTDDLPEQIERCERVLSDLP
jgi:hypothetical protein